MRDQNLFLTQNDLHFDREILYNEYLTELRDINQILEKKQG